MEDTRMLEATAEVFAGFHANTMELHELCRQLTQWKHLMSYNDSYFGEPDGDLKRLAYEIDRVLPSNAALTRRP